VRRFVLIGRLDSNSGVPDAGRAETRGSRVSEGLGSAGVLVMVLRRGAGARRGGGFGGDVGEDATSRICMGGAALRGATAGGGVSFGSCGQRHA
jgi:hypothetical protein